MATVKVQKTLCICSYSLLSVVVLVYFAAITVGLLTVVLIPKEKVFEFCAGEMTGSTPKWLLNLLDKAKVKIDDIDGKLYDVVDRHMCKLPCPCVSSVNFALWDEPMRSDMRKTQREGGEYRFTGSYSNFLACYNDKKDKFAEDDIAIIESEQMASIESMEQEFKCSGFCQTPKFWLSQDVTTGPPPNNCAIYLKERFDESAGKLAWTTLGTGCVILLTFFVHYGLYLKDSDQVAGRKRRFIFDG